MTWLRVMVLSVTADLFRRRQQRLPKSQQKQ